MKAAYVDLQINSTMNAASPPNPSPLRMSPSEIKPGQRPWKWFAAAQFVPSVGVFDWTTAAAE